MDRHGGQSSCFHCRADLSNGERFVESKDQKYCVKCFERLFAKTCEECKTKIGPGTKYITSEELHWHESCFNCNYCHTSLVDANFKRNDNKLICDDCHDKKFAPKCDSCGQAIRKSILTYKDKAFHSDCFKCTHCAKTLEGHQIASRDNKPYCEQCFDRLFAKKCAHCSKTIAGQFTHRDDKPYCLECFNQLFAKKCFRCNETIGLTGVGGAKFATYEDRQWHNDCFRCHRCRASLVGKKFVFEGSDVVCPTCN